MRKKLVKRDLEKLQRFEALLLDIHTKVADAEFYKLELISQYHQIKVEQKRFLSEIEQEYDLVNGRFSVNPKTGAITRSREGVK